MSRLADAMSAGNPKILTIDIETSPHLGYVWSIWNQNVSLSQLKEHGQVICWAAKWYGSKQVMFASDHHDGHDVMVEKAWELLDQADIVVTYNGDSFDIKHLKREFLLAGLHAPTPAKSVDLYKVIRRQFKFVSNKLDNVSQELDIGAKVKHEGFGLWVACMAGDPKAWARMRKYNVGDVKLTEQLYDRLRGWMPSHPHMGTIPDDTTPRCNQCGSEDLERNGTYRAKLIDYIRWRCLNCGANLRGNRHSRAAASHGIA